jgi:hypothetical protein
MRHEERKSTTSLKIRFIAIRQTNDFGFSILHNLKTESSPPWHIFTHKTRLLMRQQHATFSLLQRPLSQCSQTTQQQKQTRKGRHNGNAPASYSGGAPFEPRPGRWLIRVRFLQFPVLPSKSWDIASFMWRPFPSRAFIIFHHQSSSHWTPY